MLVVFAAFGREQLGISYLSAALRGRGHTTRLAFEPGLFHDRYYLNLPRLGAHFARGARLVDEIVAQRPDLVAFSVLTPTYTWALDVARRLKERVDVPVIVGGVHPSAVPELCAREPAFDFVCVGEGEEALPELCAALERGERPPLSPIPNLWWEGLNGELVRGPNAPFIQDLDALPLPDKGLWDDALRIEDNYLILTARGCPYRCKFCFNNYFARLPGAGGGRYVRKRGVGACLEELGQMKARYDFGHVEFIDDIFTFDKAWLADFLPRYRREVGLPFSCLVHPRFIDRETACWLADAGCDRVQMGIQSVDEDYRRGQLQRVETNEHVFRALEAMSAAGLRMKLDHMFGLPGEPLDAQDRAVELFRRFSPDRINTYWLSYLPGTEMFEQAVESGHLSAEEADKVLRGVGRVFHDRNEARVEEHAALYRRYDLLFRLHPLLPRRLRAHLGVRDLPELPEALTIALGAACDLAAAVVQRDTETWSYGRHYLRQLRRHLRERLATVAVDAEVETT